MLSRVRSYRKPKCFSSGASHSCVLENADPQGPEEESVRLDTSETGLVSPHARTAEDLAPCTVQPCSAPVANRYIGKTPECFLKDRAPAQGSGDEHGAAPCFVETAPFVLRTGVRIASHDARSSVV